MTRLLLIFLLGSSALGATTLTNRFVTGQQITNGTQLTSVAPGGGGGGGNGLLTGLIAYWRCEDADNADWVDATGNGHTLTHHGNITQTPLTAKHNLGRQVVAGTYADSASSAFKRTASWSLAGWFRSASAIDGSVAASEFGTGHNWFIFGPGGGVFEFGFRNPDDAGNTVAVSTTSFTTGTYHHIAIGFDSALQQLWIQVDNEARVSTSYTGTPRTDAENFTINGFSGGGSGIDGASNNGGVDEIGYWTRSLTTQNVTDLQILFYDDFN